MGNIKSKNYLRIVARLDIKNENLIKGIHLEGLRKLGDPNEFAKKYYDEGVDEIIYGPELVYMEETVLRAFLKKQSKMFLFQSQLVEE